MKIKDEMIIAAERVLGKVFKYGLKCILIQTVLATVVRITKAAEGVCFSILSSFSWLLKTFPSMKVTLEKHFNIKSTYSWKFVANYARLVNVAASL